MGLWGRLEAIRAPTIGKAKKGTMSNRPPTVRLAPQLLGTCADRARTYSGMLAKNIASERPASDQASTAAARVLTSPTPRPCSLAPSVTVAPFYAAVVSQALRRALRGVPTANYLDCPREGRGVSG